MDRAADMDKPTDEVIRAQRAKRRAALLKDFQARWARGWDRFNMDWHGQAACRSADPNLFSRIHDTYDKRHTREDDSKRERSRLAAARRVCADCLVRIECQAYGLRLGELDTDSIFAGMTWQQRKMWLNDHGLAKPRRSSAA